MYKAIEYLTYQVVRLISALSPLVDTIRNEYITGQLMLAELEMRLAYVAYAITILAIAVFVYGARKNVLSEANYHSPGDNIMFVATLVGIIASIASVILTASANISHINAATPTLQLVIKLL